MSDKANSSSIDSIEWYHTIELPGTGPTPGEYDLRSVADVLPLPADMSGMRCLDVGTHDGFWAFEMEKRGADVVAIDIESPDQVDWPEPRPPMSDELRSFIADRKSAFFHAHEALNSSVDHRYMSVYELTPEAVGRFDLVFIGTLLHHLRDPVRALMAIRSVADDQLMVSGVFSIAKTIVYPTVPVAELVSLPGRPLWELPNLAGLNRQINSAGFEILSRTRPHLQRYGAGHIPDRTRIRGRPRLWPSQLMLRYGVPHVGIHARRRELPA